jgi:hypothetical protein
MQEVHFRAVILCKTGGVLQRLLGRRKEIDGTQDFLDVDHGCSGRAYL